MINFSRIDNKVRVHVKHGIFYSDSEFTVDIQQGYDYQAELLRKQLADRLRGQIERIKREAYNQGWKDAKSKKVAKETFFTGNW